VATVHCLPHAPPQDWLSAHAGDVLLGCAVGLLRTGTRTHADSSKTEGRRPDHRLDAVIDDAAAAAGNAAVAAAGNTAVASVAVHKMPVAAVAAAVVAAAAVVELD